ncbi:MAG TPA: HAD-IIB family hydrolase [Microbacteriaceae bacterium]|nr:HAD-IIB family hydrolase [Microbacteriaceae bacterium]
MTHLPALMAFDLDDTLAPSKTPTPTRILTLLLELLERTEVAVISGGNFEQFESQLLNPLTSLALSKQDLSNPEAVLQKLHLLPTCGTRFYQREDSKWVARYEENLTFEERSTAAQALEQEAQKLGLWEPLTWGQIIEDRGSQITFSALGQRAPVEAKEIWDPSGKKKNWLREAVQKRLPNLEVRSGGSTSIDVTRKGIDKAYGMRKLQKQTGIPFENMLFIGDRLDEDGNDYPVKVAGVPCHAVTGWEETADFLEKLLGT